VTWFLVIFALAFNAATIVCGFMWLRHMALMVGKGRAPIIAIVPTSISGQRLKLTTIALGHRAKAWRYLSVFVGLTGLQLVLSIMMQLGSPHR